MHNCCLLLRIGAEIGPGDAGPTSSGQLILDFVNRKLPGIPPAAFSVVDARDVAEAMCAAATRGVRGERYLAAGRSITMAELMQALEKVSAVPAPKMRVPVALLYAPGAANESWHLLSGKPALISLAAVRFMIRERDHSRFDSSKGERELGVRFRPLKETLRDSLSWYRNNGWLEGHRKSSVLRAAGESAR